MKEHTLLSVVVPVYNEEENVLFFYDALRDVIEKIDGSYVFEVLFIDDGSTDESANNLSKLKPTTRVSPKLIRLSRNFGKEAAVTAGLAATHGDAAIIIDVDLQHPIEKIPEFIESWQSGAEVVVGIRNGYSARGVLKIWASKMFYKLLSSMSETEIVPHSTDYRLISREVIDEYNKLTEHNRIVRGLIDWLGYDRKYVYFTENDRYSGRASYGYKKLFKLAITTFIQHSFFPLRLAGYLGTSIAIAAGMLGLFFLVQDIVLRDPMGLQVSGTAMLATLILFLVGIILMGMGLMGLYVASIRDESANRPLYIVRKSGKV